MNNDMFDNDDRQRIIPFGKYKGQPADVLAGDPSYLQWLNGQGWVRDKYPQFYTVIINNFQEPSETPEHNALQALFLDDDLCIRFLSAVVRTINDEYIFRRLTSKQFEVEGVDVILKYLAWSLKQYTSFVKNEQMRGRRPSLPLDDLVGWATDGLDCAIEIKPSLGDDFPAVLRQARRMRAYQQCVVFRDFVATSVTLEQVQAMFRLSRVLLFSLAEIQHAEPDRRFDEWMQSQQEPAT